MSKTVKITNPADAAAAAVVGNVPGAGQRRSAVAEGNKRLTVDIAAELHKAANNAANETGRKLREVVAEALEAYPPVAEALENARFIEQRRAEAQGKK